jgi:hypothetical protein
MACCTLCDMCFIKESDLADHMREKHSSGDTSEDPLNAIFGTQDSKKPSLLFETPAGEAPLKSVDADKFANKKLLATKAKKSEEQSVPSTATTKVNTKGTAKGLGFALNPLDADSNNNKSNSDGFDFLASLAAEKDAASEAIESSIFQQLTDDGKSSRSDRDSGLFSTLNTNTDRAPRAGTLRVGGTRNDEDEFTTEDLRSATSFLAKEEESDLEYELFGKSLTKAKVEKQAVVVTKRVVDNELPVEIASIDALTEMEKITLDDGVDKMPTVRRASTKSADKVTEKQVEDEKKKNDALQGMDMATFDLDSYLANESGGGGGGLFD